MHVRGNPSLIDLVNRKGSLNMTDANFNLKKRPFQMKGNKALRNTSGILKAKQSDDIVVQ